MHHEYVQLLCAKQNIQKLLKEMEMLNTQIWSLCIVCVCEIIILYP
jgi:hypothetical protein